MAAYWNVPTRRWLAATRTSTAPGCRLSRITFLRWPRLPTPSWWGSRARGAPRRSRTHATSARGRPSRRRLGRMACDRSPSGARRDGVHECRAPHRGATRDRHQVEATRNQTDDRRTPARRVTPPSSSASPRSRATPSGDRNVAGSTQSSSATPSLSAMSGCRCRRCPPRHVKPARSRANELLELEQRSCRDAHDSRVSRPAVPKSLRGVDRRRASPLVP